MASDLRTTPYAKASLGLGTALFGLVLLFLRPDAGYYKLTLKLLSPRWVGPEVVTGILVPILAGFWLSARAILQPRGQPGVVSPVALSRDHEKGLCGRAGLLAGLAFAGGLVGFASIPLASTVSTSSGDFHRKENCRH